MEISTRQKRLMALKPVLIILFSFLLVMNVANLLFVLVYSTSSFFSGTILSHFSIYSSRTIFLVHTILCISTCSAILFLVIKKEENRFIPALIVLYFLLFIYPFITG